MVNTEMTTTPTKQPEAQRLSLLLATGWTRQKELTQAADELEKERTARQEALLRRLKQGGHMSMYKTGSKADVLQRMAEHAIRDQESLIDAYTPITPFGIDDESREVIVKCKKNIDDYRRIMRMAKQR